MAFDLNKNDGSAESTPAKSTGKSKFDLSKSEETVPVAPTQTNSSKGWVIALVGAVIIGGGIWYYSSQSQSTGAADVAATTVNAPDSSVADSVASSTAAQNVPAATTTESTASTNETVAAAEVPAATTAATSTAVPNASRQAGSAADPAATSQANRAASPAAAATQSSTVGSATSIESASTVQQLNNKVPATFAQGSSTFNHLNRSLIKQINSYLAKNPNASINVKGYASSDGPLALNQTISQARADAFKNYLVSKKIAQDRVQAVGKGIENPIASNNTNAGRRKNRRVEITFQ